LIISVIILINHYSSGVFQILIACYMHLSAF